jgi:hypothetical protein
MTVNHRFVIASVSEATQEMPSEISDQVVGEIAPNRVQRLDQNDLLLPLSALDLFLAADASVAASPARRSYLRRSTRFRTAQSSGASVLILEFTRATAGLSYSRPARPPAAHTFRQDRSGDTGFRSCRRLRLCVASSPRRRGISENRPVRCCQRRAAPRMLFPCPDNTTENLGPISDRRY